MDCRIFFVLAGLAKLAQNTLKTAACNLMKTGNPLGGPREETS